MNLNPALGTLKERGFIQQCTDLELLEQFDGQRAGGFLCRG